MLVFKITGCVAAAAIASFISIGATRAAMAPIVHQSGPIYQNVDCAVGFHIGLIGGCVIATDNEGPSAPPPAVIVDGPAPVAIERRAVDDGCQTQTVNRTDAAGNSETTTITNCP